MVKTEQFRTMALSFPGTFEYQHFNRRAFKSKRIFVTLNEEERDANFLFTPDEQEEFCNLLPDFIKPLSNKWGEKGATQFLLDHVPEEIIWSGLEVAYKTSML